MDVTSIEKAYTLIGDLAVLIKAIISAVADKDPDRVEKILPDELRTSIARHAAEANASEKFG